MQAIALLLLAAAPDDPPFRQWPLGQTGLEPRTILCQHGQFQNFEHTSSGVHLHAGVDIAAEPGEAVYSLTTGTVVQVDRSSFTQSSLVIRDEQQFGFRDEKQKAGYKYVHLDPRTIELEVGDQVRRGDYLGDVTDFFKVEDGVMMRGSDEYDHLHLERVHRDSEDSFFVRVVKKLVPEDWLTVHAFGNPLDPGDALTPTSRRALNDDLPPTFHEIEGTEFGGGRVLLLKSLADPLEEGGAFFRTDPTPLADGELAGEKLDLAVRVTDLCNGDSMLSLCPYHVCVEIGDARGERVYRRSLNLDQTVTIDEDSARRFFLERARLSAGRLVPCSVGDFVDRDFYLIVTNGRSNHGSNDVPDVTYWDTQGLTGAYTVTLKATDVRGNRAEPVVFTVEL